MMINSILTDSTRPVEAEYLQDTSYGPVDLLVLQPTTFCNLDCSYCYLPDRQLKHKFSLDLLEPIFHNLFSSPYLNKDFTIVWHAGEPLAMPPNFYKSACDIIDDIAQKLNKNQYHFEHSIQTNGTLINQDWCDFFKTHNVKIGVSVDGPDFIHDANRKTKTGLGTHASTMRGISLLKKNDIEFSVIAVLTQESLNYPDEIYNFFLENKINKVGFNVEEKEGANQNSSLSGSGTDLTYRNFMNKLYELVNQPANTLEIREFERIKRGILNGGGAIRGQFHPFTMINIDYKGDFMTFSPELLSLNSSKYGEFVLGNVMTDSFESICETDKFKRINDDIQAGVNLCKQTCEYFSLCGGGAPANKYFENGSFNSSETMYCRYTEKILTDIVLADIEQTFGLS